MCFCRTMWRRLSMCLRLVGIACTFQQKLAFPLHLPRAKGSALLKLLSACYCRAPKAWYDLLQNNAVVAVHLPHDIARPEHEPLGSTCFSPDTASDSGSRRQSAGEKMRTLSAPSMCLGSFLHLFCDKAFLNVLKGELHLALSGIPHCSRICLFRH